jgi:hypothetical protein
MQGFETTADEKQDQLRLKHGEYRTRTKARSPEVDHNSEAMAARIPWPPRSRNRLSKVDIEKGQNNE